jgi:NitT/TauT family transport system ATP-binding protein
MTAIERTSAPTTDLVRLTKVNKVYGRAGRQTEALRDINLTMREGEFVALLGPSGCGKSTLLRIVTGLVEISSGEALYRGQPLRGVNPATSIVFQAFALFPWLTVLENVEVALKPLGLDALARTRRALRLLDQVGLDGFEKAYPRELSGGMRQKVGFARAMAVEPELLCLDEPFSALDPLSAQSLRAELMELWLSGTIPTKAILMVSHNIEEAVLMADRLVIMDKGPGHIVAELSVNLPHPRNRKDRAVTRLVDQVYAMLVGQTKTEAEEMGAEPGQRGRGQVRALPHAPINQISGLLERINDEVGDVVDIYLLAHQLGVPTDDLLPIIEASELLGFVVADKGDLRLTALGQTFADASIQARKEMFRTRIRRVPLVRWLTTMLEAEEDRRLSWNVFEASLGLEFPPDEATRQLDTAVDWGRYAEVLGYDNDDNAIFMSVAAGDPVL